MRIGGLKCQNESCKDKQNELEANIHDLETNIQDLEANIQDLEAENKQLKDLLGKGV